MHLRVCNACYQVVVECESFLAQNTDEYIALSSFTFNTFRCINKTTFQGLPTFSPLLLYCFVVYSGTEAAEAALRPPLRPCIYF